MKYRTCALIPVCAVLAATQAWAAESETARSETGVEEVVVTATKRESSLQDVPMAIQAFTAESLERMGADQVESYYRLVPNFAVVDRGAGARLYSIRGISTGLVTQGASTVGVYVDEMPVSA